MTDKNEEDMSYMERVEKIREEKQNKDRVNSSSGSEDPEMTKKIVIFLGSFLSLGLLIGFIAIGELGVGIIVAGIAIVVLIALANVDDEAWEEFLEEAERAKQQQEDGSSESDSKRICSSCGWQNPSNNNFCHDCGSELS
jgi:hypothetical protein